MKLPVRNPDIVVILTPSWMMPITMMDRIIRVVDTSVVMDTVADMLQCMMNLTTTRTMTKTTNQYITVILDTVMVMDTTATMVMDMDMVQCMMNLTTTRTMTKTTNQRITVMSDTVTVMDTTATTVMDMVMDRLIMDMNLPIDSVILDTMRTGTRTMMDQPMMMRAMSHSLNMIEW